jgi:Cation efflux family
MKPLAFDLSPLLASIFLGAVAIQFSRPANAITSEIHRITFPVATLLSSILTFFASNFNGISLLPAFLVYYGIFTIVPSPPGGTLWTKMRNHPLLKKILHKEDSKKIFVFLCLNLGFMCVQMGYGIYTNSLGLVSDSIHMLVDCAAIAFGLAASVLADDFTDAESPEGYTCDHHQHNDQDHDHHHDHSHEEKPSHPHSHQHTHSHDHKHNHPHSHDTIDSHTHGHLSTGKWAKLEDLAGFANGVFLVFVCLSILAEALGRLIWPEEVVEVEQLLVVSILGLAVNLVGVFSFNHGYPSSCSF